VEAYKLKLQKGKKVEGIPEPTRHSAMRIDPIVLL
jgi:hypothetical protein